MIESHPGTMVSARIQQHFEYLFGESAVPELDEDELSALFFPPGRVDESVSIFSRHAFVPQEQDSHLCSHCSNLRTAGIHSIADEPRQPQPETPEPAAPDPNREWSSRRHFQGMSPRELEAERQRSLRLTKRKGSSKWMLVTVVIVGIIGVAVAAGYFMAESGSEELAVTNTPIEPGGPPGPVDKVPRPDNDANPAPLATPSDTPTPANTPVLFTPAPLMPTPTLTLNEIFQLVDSGQWSEEETVRELERRSADDPVESPTLVPSISAVPTPTAAPGSSGRGSAEWITTLEFAVHQLVNF